MANDTSASITRLHQPAMIVIRGAILAAALSMCATAASAAPGDEEVCKLALNVERTGFAEGWESYADAARRRGLDAESCIEIVTGRSVRPKPPPELFAIIICEQEGEKQKCFFPTNGMKLFETAERCKAYAGTGRSTWPGGYTFMQCVKRSVAAWEPVQ